MSQVSRVALETKLDFVVLCIAHVDILKVIIKIISGNICGSKMLYIK